MRSTLPRCVLNATVKLAVHVISVRNNLRWLHVLDRVHPRVATFIISVTTSCYVGTWLVSVHRLPKNNEVGSTRRL